jgi:LacI family transcriptional regulator
VTDGIYVVGEDPTPNALAGPLRLEGVHYGLRESGLQLTGVVPCAWDVVPARETVCDWLSDGARPAGLVCLNDRVAMGVYQALADRGLRVPDDVAIVSFDGSDLARWLQPRLTSVTVPYAEMGAMAVHRLMEPEGAARDHASVTAVPMSVEWGGSLRHRRLTLPRLV